MEAAVAYKKKIGFNGTTLLVSLGLHINFLNFL